MSNTRRTRIPASLRDPSRRMADAVNLHLAADPGNIGKWCAIRLADGDSDGVVYDTRADAVRHQLHEQLCAYICIPPGGMQPIEAASYINYHRQLYDAGFRLPDPEFGLPMMPLREGDQRKQIRALVKGRR